MLFATAVAEVATNIIKHGQHGARSSMVLTLRVDDDSIEAVFADDGIAVELGDARTRLPTSFPSQVGVWSWRGPPSTSSPTSGLVRSTVGTSYDDDPERRLSARQMPGRDSRAGWEAR